MMSARAWRRSALAVSLVLGTVVAVVQPGAQVESGLRTVRDSVRSQAASGQLHVVEIDARSLAAVDRWPWPRAEHARVVDALRAAGARTIAFDVDFSAASNPVDDAAFAAALGRAGGAVVLPTFRQAAAAGTDAHIDSLPIAPLRQSAFLAAVSIQPDRDGFVRRAPVGMITNGVARPSLSALLAGTDGIAFDKFPIDYAIEPASIPRHSFIDVTRGAKTADLRGKDVLIGATAIELGDRYAVPRHGVIPGVIIQALATETLRSGVPRELPSVLGLGVALALAFGALRAASNKRIALYGGGGAAALMLAVGLGEQFLHTTMALLPALAALASTMIFALVRLRLTDHHVRARVDPSTGLPNRLALEESLRDRPQVQVVAAVIARFDDIAASLGSEGTAQMVQRIADRFRLAAGDGAIYRLEDRVLAWDSAFLSAAELHDALDGLRSVMHNPVEIGGRRIDVTVAMGIASDAGEAAAHAIGAATAAASHALAEGVPWLRSDKAHVDVADQGLSMMGELDEALDRDEIEVLFQPKLDIAFDRIASAEALVRWTHPVRGPISPDVFIPLAEQTNRIDRLTLFVIRKTLAAITACAQTGKPISIAVNISAKLLSSPAFADALDLLLSKSPDLLDRLIFEVTESAAMADIEAAASALQRYRRLGIAISMDDYGTGQSTLTYIKRLPLSEIKIDRSFVQNAHINQDDGILVQSTIELAHKLGMRVVAEGVEDQACLEFLARSGCDYAQGWLISKAVPLTALKAMIVEAERLAA